MIELKKTSIQIPSETLTKIKSIAAKKGTTQNNIINNLITKGLENIEDTKGKMKSRIINNELPKPKISEQEDSNLKDLGGFIKIDKEIDAIKLKRIIHSKEDFYL
jgi:predicted DNA-binding protein